MPFEVRKRGDKWGVYNLAKKHYAKKEFNTKKSAENMIKVWMKYAHNEYRKKKK